MVTRRRNSLSLDRSRRHDVEALQLGEDLMVDVVDFRHVGIMEAGRSFHRRHDAHRRDVAAIGDDDGRVAGPQRLELAQRIDLDDGVVVGAEVAERRNVLLRAVGEDRLDAKLARSGRAWRNAYSGGLMEMEAMSPLPLCHWAPWTIHSRNS